MRLLLATLSILPLLWGCDNIAESKTDAVVSEVKNEISSNVSDDTLAKSDIDEFVNSFMGYCVLTMPRIDKVDAMSRVNSWEPLSDDMLLAFGPAEPSIDMNGWIVKGDFNPIFVGIADGNVDSERHRNCSIMSKVTNVEGLAEKIVKLVGASQNPRATDIEAGQRHRIWSYSNLGESYRLLILDAPELAPGVITVSSNHISKIN